MGADANSEKIVCTRGAEIALTDEFIKSDSTLSPSKAGELIETCLSTAASHEDELQKLKEVGTKIPILPSEIGTDFNFRREIVWKNVAGFAVLHLLALVGIYIMIAQKCYHKTTIYSFWLIYASGQGVTMGAHRLWSHRAFKAKTWLKVILLWLHTLAGQNCLWVWVRDHRQHHKFSDTDADPHNANRGFFFSHIGWLLSKKHPKVKEYGNKIDMSDLEADPWIMFQKRHYKVLYTIFALCLPTLIPIVFWGEDPIISLFTSFFTRTILNLNATWLVNSAAHLYGTRPFDKTMFPVESMFISFMTVGEGWHNYHHAFPWDYRASELGSPLNLTGFFIDLLAKFGIIFDRKEATSNMVKNRVMRTGDKSHKKYGTDEGRSAFKTLFNMWPHPLNPTYMSLHPPKPKTLQSNGYALIPDELKKSELDDEILSKENALLTKQQEEEEKQKTEANKIYSKLSKYITEVEQNTDLSADLLLANNNNIKNDKSQLNATTEDFLNNASLLTHRHVVAGGGTSL